MKLELYKAMKPEEYKQYLDYCNNFVLATIIFYGSIIISQTYLIMNDPFRAFWVFIPVLFGFGSMLYFLLKIRNVKKQMTKRLKNAHNNKS